jgi:hypothetical protein
MAYWASLLAVLTLTIVATVKFKERSFYILFLATYTQSFIVPFLYTSRYIGRDLARSLVLFKEFLLLGLFVCSVVILLDRFRPPWPRPLLPLLFFTAYCIFRFLVGVIFLGDGWGQGLYKLRMVCFPLEILMAVMVFTALKPEFGKRFLRDMTYILSALAVVAIAIFLWAPPDFWVQHADIAAYDLEVKGESEEALSLEKGVSLTGEGRVGFEFLSSFRAMGTFGDPLTLGFSMAVPVLLLFFYFRKRLASVLMLAATTGALLFSLSRSVWIFCCVIGGYVLLRRRRYGLLLGLGACAVAFLIIWSPLAELLANSLSNLSPSNPGDPHAEGILWFYTRGFTDLRNILGRGMADEVQDIPESGYAFLLQHFGLLAYASFVWFCVSLFRQLRKAPRYARILPSLGQAIPLGILVIMHTSQYPFAFSEFISLWYVVGLCLSSYFLVKPNPTHKPAQAGGQARLEGTAPTKGVAS